MGYYFRQSINNGNWKTLEAVIRRTVGQYNKTITIFTGTYDILQLPNSKNRLQRIYLQGSKGLPVPKYIWKIVYDVEAHKGIAIIVYNNPFWKRGKIEFCKNICKESGWYKPSWRKSNSGYLFCCKVSDFINKVDFIPRVRATSVLRGFLWSCLNNVLYLICNYNSKR